MHPSRKLYLCLLFVLCSTMAWAFFPQNQHRFQAYRTPNTKMSTIDGLSPQSEGLLGPVPLESPKAMTVYVQRDGKVMVETPKNPDMGVVDYPLYRPISQSAFQKLMDGSTRGIPANEIVYSNSPKQRRDGIRRGTMKLEVDEPKKHVNYPQHIHTSRCIDELIERIRAKTGAAHFPTESGTVVMELDMSMTKAQYRYYYENQRLPSRPAHMYIGPRRRFKRKSLRSEFTIWPGGIIPFIKDNSFTARDQVLLKESMKDWMDKTCIQFKPAQQEDPNVLSVQDGKGCTSFVGRVGGQQHLKLHEDCRVKHIVTHELGHVIGLIHEHQRPDRDDFITVASQNVGKGRMKNYQKFENNKIDSYGVEYDYTSIMHYGKTAFSKDGVSTTMITSDPNFQDIIGTGSIVTFKDAKVVNAMYRCSAHCRRPPQCGKGFVNKNCQCVCPDGTQSCARKVQTRTRTRPSVRPGLQIPNIITWLIPQTRRRQITTPRMVLPRRRPRFRYSHTWDHHHDHVHPGHRLVPRTMPWSRTHPEAYCETHPPRRRLVTRRGPSARPLPMMFMDSTMYR